MTPCGQFVRMSIGKTEMLFSRYLTAHAGENGASDMVRAYNHMVN